MAVVAAIGMLAPTSGTNAAGLQDVGFTLEPHADGTVLLTWKDTVNPDKLHDAMDKAGIPADIQRVPIPDDWNTKLGVYCRGEMKRRLATAAFGTIIFSGSDDHQLEFRKSELRAGDVIWLRSFQKEGRQVFVDFGVMPAGLGTCVPVLGNVLG